MEKQQMKSTSAAVAVAAAAKSAAYQVLSVLSVSYLCISCGAFLGYTSSAIESIQKDKEFNYTLTEDDISNIGSLGPLGALCGSLFTTVAIKYFGIKGALLYCGLPAFLCSWGTITLSTSLSTILVGRFLGGVGTGMTISSTPLYVISMVDMQWRGRLGIAPQFLMLFGILISYCIGALVNWTMHSLACLFIALPAAIFLYFAPHTPRWLLINGHHEETLTLLERLHGKADGRIEYDRLANSITVPKATEAAAAGTTDSPRTSTWSNVLSLAKRWSKPETLKPICISLALMSFQQFCGINGITFYSVSIFKESSGVGYWGPNIPAILLALTQCVSSLLSTVLIDRAGRKILLLASCFITGLASIAMGIYFYIIIHYAVDDSHDHLFWLPLLVLIVFAFGFAIGLGPVAYLYITEILPEEIRTLLNPIIIAYTWSCVFAVTKSFPFLKALVYIYGVFWIYASFSAIAFIVIVFGFPETKGKSLDDVKQFFNKKYAAMVSRNFSSSSPLNNNNNNISVVCNESWSSTNKV